MPLGEDGHLDVARLRHLGRTNARLQPRVAEVRKRIAELTAKER